MRLYAENPKVEILECSEEAHAARKKELGITMVNFWTDGEKTVGGITSDKAASVTMQEMPGQITVGVADPTQENNEMIEISLPYAGESVITSDENIRVLEMQPSVKLEVQTKDLAGKTSVITIKTMEI